MGSARREPGAPSVVGVVLVALVIVLLAAGGIMLVDRHGEPAAVSIASPRTNHLVPAAAFGPSAPTYPRSGFGRENQANDGTAAGAAAAAASAPAPAAAAPVELPLGPAPAIARVPTTDRVLFLGIDDGITRDPAVLDYLKANRIPFVSFLVAGPLEADPAFWARAVAIGGTVQAHTLNHPDLTKVSADQIRHELCGSADYIERATGTRPTLFRPPYGFYNDTVRAIATECGYAALVMWKGSTNDGRVDLQEKVLTPGDILLMHWRPDLLQNLQNVVALAEEQGFRIARLEDYLQPIP